MAARNSASVLLLGVLLLGAGLVQLRQYAARPQSENRPKKRLAEILPGAMAEVVVREVAIATTEEMKRKVDELLNYDDALCRTYEARGVRLTVYVAEWGPGKMSPRLVAGHTPDVCWPAAGWERRPDEEAKHRPFNDILAEGGLRPGVLGVFAQASVVEYVVFWHQVGEKFDVYGSRGSPPWWAMLADVWHEGWGPARGQRFVRISSSRPLEEVWRLPEFAPLRAVLPLLGLAAHG